MKKSYFVLSTLLMSLVMTTTSAVASTPAVSKKVCFGSTKDEDTKGVVVLAEITQKQVTLTTIKKGFGDFNYNGTFPSFNTTVKGRDGKVYLEYEGDSSDYQDVIMIDSTLLKSATSGLLQIRARGEGFFNFVLVCKDDTRR